MRERAKRLTVKEALITLFCIASVMGMAFSVGRIQEDKAKADSIDEVNTVIDNFQTAYCAKNIDDLRPLFFAESVVAYDFAQGTVQGVFGLEEWLEGTKDDVFDVNTRISDSLTHRDIQVFANIAYVVCNYEYIDDEDHHVGVDIFTLMKMHDHWRILSLQWTGERAN
jgi:hypothetical protein